MLHTKKKKEQLKYLENIFRVEELVVDEIRVDEICANNEDFSRCKTRRFRFVRFDFSEKLVAHPDKSIVIFRSKHLGDKSTTFSKEITSKFQSGQRQLDLIERVFLPIRTDIRSTVIQHNIHLLVL